VAVGLYIATFAAVGAVAPYINLFFQSLGLSLGEIGILAAVLALVALVAAPAWGVIADQLLGSRAALVAASLAAAALSAVVGLTDVVIVAILFAILYQMVAPGLGPILDAYTLDLVGENRNRYSLFRAWGSAAFVVAVVVVGFLSDAFSLRALFAVLVVTLVVAAVLALFIPARTSAHAVRSLGGMRQVIGHRPMAAFLVASLIVWSANAMINAFFSIYLVSLSAPTVLVGSAWAIGALVEVPIMLSFPVIAKRVALNRIIALGAVAFLARIVVLSMTNDPYVAAATFVLHGLGYALLLVGGVTYVAGLAPRGRAATAQGVYAGVVAGLAMALGPAVAGIVANLTNLQTMFWLAAVFMAVGVVAMVIAMSSSRFGVQPLPQGADQSATDVAIAA
jgi:PPP family 3-phenylpropionic acid transporter